VRGVGGGAREVQKNSCTVKSQDKRQAPVRPVACARHHRTRQLRQKVRTGGCFVVSGAEIDIFSRHKSLKLFTFR
jgi:hypothetical protein